MRLLKPFLLIFLFVCSVRLYASEAHSVDIREFTSNLVTDLGKETSIHNEAERVLKELLIDSWKLSDAQVQSVADQIEKGHFKISSTLQELISARLENVPLPSIYQGSAVDYDLVSPADEKKLARSLLNFSQYDLTEREKGLLNGNANQLGYCFGIETFRIQLIRAIVDPHLAKGDFHEILNRDILDSARPHIGPYSMADIIQDHHYQDDILQMLGRNQRDQYPYYRVPGNKLSPRWNRWIVRLEKKQSLRIENALDTNAHDEDLTFGRLQSKLKTEIASGRPFLIGLDDENNKGHELTAEGYSENTNGNSEFTLRVFDSDSDEARFLTVSEDVSDHRVHIGLYPYPEASAFFTFLANDAEPIPVTKVNLEGTQLYNPYQNAVDVKDLRIIAEVESENSPYADYGDQKIRAGQLVKILKSNGSKAFVEDTSGRKNWIELSQLLAAYDFGENAHLPLVKEEGNDLDLKLELSKQPDYLGPIRSRIGNLEKIGNAYFIRTPEISGWVPLSANNWMKSMLGK